MSHWFEYFPGQHMWSQGMMFGIEMQTWGAAALGEIDQIGQKLKGHEGDNAKWWREWTSMAKRIEAFAEREANTGHQLTAGSYYLRAAVYYFCGERFIAPSERKWDTYRSCLRCFGKGIARRYANIERVEVAYEGTTLPAWFLRADVRGPAPAVVMFDGLDNAKEMSVLFAGVEIARRGIHTLAIDGPGQGGGAEAAGDPQPVRLRSARARGIRVHGEAPGSRCPTHRRCRLQHGRLLRAACGGHGASLCGMSRVGRALGLP
jgi:hypothetical protein